MITNDDPPADAFRLHDVSGVAVVIERAVGTKCARSWKILPTVGEDPDYPDVSPRDAQGFRCPLHPGEAVADVATALIDLLRDCRVADIRVVDGVHGDREPVTGGPLLFKPETIPPGARVLMP